MTNIFKCPDSLERVVWIVISLSFLLTAGCASSSKKINATYVSPLKYNSYPCPQLEQEYARLLQKSSMVNKEQDDIASSDSVAMGVGMVLFWPALLFIDNDDRREEVALLKGEINAIEESAIQKNCSSLSKAIINDRATAKKQTEEEAEKRRKQTQNDPYQ